MLVATHKFTSLLPGTHHMLSSLSLAEDPPEKHTAHHHHRVTHDLGDTLQETETLLLCVLQNFIQPQPPLPQTDHTNPTTHTAHI
jgi:hypothetical protein